MKKTNVSKLLLKRNLTIGLNVNTKLLRHLIGQINPWTMNYFTEKESIQVLRKSLRFWFLFMVPQNIKMSMAYGPLILSKPGIPGNSLRLITLWPVWGSLVKAYLPSSYDVVTLLIDGRGSAYEGDNFMHATYKQLGFIEPIDQIAVTRHVLGEL